MKMYWLHCRSVVDSLLAWQPGWALPSPSTGWIQRAPIWLHQGGEGRQLKHNPAKWWPQLGPMRGREHSLALWGEGGMAHSHRKDEEDMAVAHRVKGKQTSPSLAMWREGDMV